MQLGLKRVKNNNERKKTKNCKNYDALIKAALVNAIIV